MGSLRNYLNKRYRGLVYVHGGTTVVANLMIIKSFVFYISEIVVFFSTGEGKL